MDITEVKDIKELKAMAYDELLVAERAQSNLAKINARIQQVLQTEDKVAKK